MTRIKGLMGVTVQPDLQNSAIVCLFDKVYFLLAEGNLFLRRWVMNVTRTGKGNHCEGDRGLVSAEYIEDFSFKRNVADRGIVIEPEHHMDGLLRKRHQRATG